MTLCKTCRNGTVIESKGGRVRSYCHETLYTGFTETPIETCTSFEDKRFVSKYDLEKIAWEIKLSSSGKILGFNPPKGDKE